MKCCGSSNDVIAACIIRLTWLKATERERQLTAGKRAETTKRDFRCPICRSAIGQATHRRQLLFPFCRQINLKKVNNFNNPSRRYNNKKHVNNSCKLFNNKEQVPYSPCKRTQHCCVTCCVRLHTMLHVVAQGFKPVKLVSRQLQTFLLFRDRNLLDPLRGLSNLSF